MKDGRSGAHRIGKWLGSRVSRNVIRFPGEALVLARQGTLNI